MLMMTKNTIKKETNIMEQKTKQLVTIESVRGYVDENGTGRDISLTVYGFETDKPQHTLKPIFVNVATFLLPFFR